MKEMKMKMKMKMKEIRSYKNILKLYKNILKLYIYIIYNVCRCYSYINI